MEIKTISIVGCGWLGLPLAKALKANGYEVKGTTTSEAKLSTLEEAGIDPYLVQLGADKEDALPAGLLITDVIVVAIPPSKVGHADYAGLMCDIARQIHVAEIKHLIFVSSTAVYKDSNAILTEENEADADSGSGVVLRAAELCFDSFTVLRLGGLVGPNRHPGRFYAGKVDISNGLAPVNLIHLEDCIGIIEHMIKVGVPTGIFNAAAPEHPSRRDFYTLATAVSGLVAPQFIVEKSAWKEIHPSRILNDLAYEFKYPSLLDWLHQSY